MGSGCNQELVAIERDFGKNPRMFKRLPQRMALGIAFMFTVTCTPKTPQYTIKYAEKRAKLKNGLRLVVIPDKSTPLVQVDVRYEVGSNEDPPGKAGLAHLVEHMMFQHRFWGDNKPATFEILPQIAVGYNAYTTFGKTHYFLQSRKEDLDGLLKLEAARMHAKCDKIPVAEFEREREVVRNEIRQRGGTAEGLIPQLLLEAAYPEGHPYSHSVGGDDSQLVSITMADVCKFMKDYYVPSRATVIVAGNVDVQQVGRKVNEYFGAIPGDKPAPRVPVEPIRLKSKKIVHELDVERSQLFVMWRLPGARSADAAAARFLVGALAGRVAGFAAQWNFAISVSPFVWGGPLAPVYVLGLELYDAKDADEALSYVWKATRTAHRGFEDGVFDTETKNVIKAGFISSLEPLGARADFVADLIQYQQRIGFDSEREYVIRELEEIERLKGGKFRSFIKKTLKKDEALVVLVKAKKTGKKGDTRARLKFSAKTHDKVIEPIINPKEAYTALPTPKEESALANAERYTLGNGMRVVLLPFSAMPIATINLVFDVGAAHEPPDKSGLAGIAANALAPPVTGANVFGFIGAERRVRVDDDHTTFVVRGLEIYVEEMLKALERLIKAGDYSQKGLERRRKSFRTRNKSKRFRKQRAFTRELAKAVYGPDHPYTVTGMSTEKSLGKIGRDVAHGFRKKHYTAKNATLVVAGSFDAAKTKNYIEDTFGEWGKGRVDPQIKAPGVKRGTPMYIGVVGERAPQVDVAIAYPAPLGIESLDAERLILAAMLNQQMAKIRTELGSTYGMYASRTRRIGPTFYRLGGTIDKERAGEGIATIRKKIDSLRPSSAGFNQDAFALEFARARRAVLSRMLAQSTESYALAGRLAQIAAYRQKPDFYDNLTQRVAQATMDGVKAIIAEDLPPNAEIVLLMGEREFLDKAFADAGLTEVKFIDPK